MGPIRPCSLLRLWAVLLTRGMRFVIKAGDVGHRLVAHQRTPEQFVKKACGSDERSWSVPHRPEGDSCYQDSNDRSAGSLWIPDSNQGMYRAEHNPRKWG